jgi:hypothetical protein
MMLLLVPPIKIHHLLVAALALSFARQPRQCFDTITHHTHITRVFVHMNLRFSGIDCDILALGEASEILFSLLRKISRGRGGRGRRRGDNIVPWLDTKNNHTDHNF